MNRRIVILSSDMEAGGKYNPKYFGLGIPQQDIYVVGVSGKTTRTRTLDPALEQQILALGPGDGVMVADAEAFTYLRQFFHFGIRNENFFDCSKLRRLSIEGGAFIKCIFEDAPSKEELEYFLSPEFSKVIDYGWFKHKVVHTVPEALGMIQYFDSLPLDTHFGFDYEASGMPLDIQFEISGASLCTTQFGGFISFTDCRHNNTPEEYQGLLKALGRFLEKRQDHVWVYNMQYEFQVSHRMLGVSLYNLCDASTINVLDGNHLKKYSLKWTAQYILGVNVWDTEFDRISDLVDSMLFQTVGRLKAEKHKELKVTPQNFKQTPEWAQLCQRCKGYEAELEALILEYWGNPFMCIPSDILGHYCNLDAFYTLMLYEAKRNEYSQEAFNTFLDNTRMGSILHSSGLYIDEDFRMKYHNECLKMMNWGITYCATARSFINLKRLEKKCASQVKKFHPIVQKLIQTEQFFKGNIMDITKNILSTHIDTLDVTETGLDESKMFIDFGDEFTGAFRDILVDAMNETKMKTKIDDGIVRKKKILGIIAEKLNTLFGLDQVTLKPEKIDELEEYVRYKNAYTELQKISKNQLGDINNIPLKIYAAGQWFEGEAYSDYISDKYFKCKAPIENELICHEFTEDFKAQTAYLAAILDSTQQLNGAEKFYEGLGIKTIEEAFQHFMTAWENYVKGGGTGDYPEKVFTLASKYYGSIKVKKDPTAKLKKDQVTVQDEDQVKEIWSNFNGYIAQEQFFKYVSDQFLEYGKPFEETDLSNDFFFMRKLVLNYLLYKKYSKVLGTYIDGMFKEGNKWVIEGEDRIPLRYAEPGEPGAIEKSFCHYEVNTKSSKR